MTKENLKTLGGWFLVIAIVFGIYSYFHWYVPYSNLKKGFVVVDTFDCPDYHSYKATLSSHIVHPPDDRYYDRTSASNAECFDSVEHAEAQGFRLPLNY